MTVSKKITAVIAIFLVSNFANANLISNGGFEDNSLNDNSWRWFLSSDVNNWSGSNIEIWDSLQGVDAFEGENHAELNAHPFTGNVFTISQTFNTVVGMSYDLSFAYRARVNNNEAFRVEVDSDSNNIFSQLVDDHVTGAWKVFVGSFEAQGATSTLSFTSVTPATSTVGNFIDDIQVLTSPSQVNVSAPGSLLFMAFTLVFAGARRFVK